MSFVIVYHESVVHEDIPKLSSTDRIRIQRAIERKLATEPELFGLPLRRSLKGYWKFRVGDYRAIFRIAGRQVKIFMIQHRSVVYTHLAKRTP